MQQLSITAQISAKRLPLRPACTQRIRGPGACARRSRGSGGSPRSLGRSGRHRFGPRHHDMYAANCCLGCHSTKAASWSPPSESRTGARLLDRTPVNQLQGCATPAGFGPMGGPVRTAGAPSYTYTNAPPTRTHAYTHSYTNWGLNEPESQTRSRCRWGNISEYNCTGPLTSHNLVIDLLK